MRANMAPAGSVTRDTEREAKDPGLCSTRRRRERSGCTHAGIFWESEDVDEDGVMMALVEDFKAEVDFPLGTCGGADEVMAAGDML